MKKKHKPQRGTDTSRSRSLQKTEGSNLKAPVKKGTNPRRVSFAARFGGMAGPLKDAKGEPTRLQLALRAWGFRNKESARNFAARHKKKPKSLIS